MDIKDSYLHGTVGVVKSISVSADKLKYILADIAGTVREVTLPVATTSANGLMSSGDKTKLDNLSSTIGNYITLNTDQEITGTKTFTKQLKFTVALGTAPFLVTSDTKVDNLNADKLDNLDSSDFVRSYGVVGANSKKGNWLGYTYNTTEHGGVEAGGVLSFGLANYGSQLNGYASKSNPKLYYRSYDSEGWSNWKTIAFTDSNITGNAATATHASTADKLKTKRKLWGNDFDGSADVSGDMTGVGTINNYFNFQKGTSSNAALHAENIFSTVDYVHLYVSNLDKSRTDRPLVLQHGYGNVGIGASLPTHKLTVNGDVKATSFIGNLDGTYVNKLTNYSKATAIAALAATDTLNAALGKLEYKADVAYDLVKGAYDGDGTIENLAEILKVLDGIKDTETIKAIIGKYLPLTGGTLNSGTDTPLIILGTDHSWIGFKNSSGTDLGWIGVLNSKLPSFYSDKSYKIWHEGNDGSGSGLDADTLDGYHANATNTPWNSIPVIRNDGVMEVGCYLDFHYDNTTNSGHSTTLVCTGNYSNTVNLPSTSGTLALTNGTIDYAKVLKPYASRPTSLNVNFSDGGIRNYKATGSTTEGKCSADAHIIHCAWDAENGHNYQLALINANKNTFGLEFRGQSGYTWSDWHTVLTDLNYDKYLGYIGYNKVQTASKSQYLTGISSIRYQNESSEFMFIGDPASVDSSQTTGGAILAYNNGPLRFYAGAKQILTINANSTVRINGKLGIDVNPTFSLHVNGAVKATSYVGTNIRIECDKDGILGNKYNEINNYTDALDLNYSSSTTMSLCVGGGNVGIGTRTPSSKLDVIGFLKCNQYIDIRDISNTKNRLTFQISSGIGRLYTYSDEDSTFRTLYLGRNDPNAIVITADGNVSIGRDTPRLKLDVSGNILATKFITSGGSSTLFVKGDGSLDSNTYATTTVLGNYVTLDTAQTITGLKTFESNSETTGVSLILKNKAWTGGMSTAMDFYNGGNYTVPNARIATYMNGDGRSGGTLIFYTQARHDSSNPNPNGLYERFRLGDDGTSTLTEALTINGSESVLTLNNASGGNVGLTFSRGSKTAWSIIDSGGNLLIKELSSNTTRVVLYEASQGGSAFFAGSISATAIVKSGGTASQFLKADGSVDSNSYATTTSLGDYLPRAGGMMHKDAYIAWGNASNDLYITKVADWSTITDYGLRIISSTTQTSKAPTTYCTALHVRGAYGFLLASSSNGANFYIANIYNIDTTGAVWNKLIHSNNYTSYTVKKDGTGASGTWGISITGNAGSASTSAKLSSTTVISAKALSLSNASWTDTGYTFESLASGTYAVQVTCGNLVASGIMSVYKNIDDTAGDEIPLHVYHDSTQPWRPYLRTSSKKLLISSNDGSATSRTVTIKIAQIL